MGTKLGMEKRRIPKKFQISFFIYKILQKNQLKIEKKMDFEESENLDEFTKDNREAIKCMFVGVGDL